MEEEKIVDCKRLESELRDKCGCRNINDAIVFWLAFNINTDSERVKPSPDEIRDMLQNQNTVLYLLIWPIMEQRHFSGFFRSNKIDDAAEELQKYYNDELNIDLDKIVERFFKRYNIAKDNNNKHFRNLQPDSEIGIEYQEILMKKDYTSLHPKEKIKLLLFVIYRYRNNIFHGNKNIQEWSKYELQINDCLFGMMKLMDCMKKHHIVV